MSRSHFGPVASDVVEGYCNVPDPSPISQRAILRGGVPGGLRSNQPPFFVELTVYG